MAGGAVAGTVIIAGSEEQGWGDDSLFSSVEFEFGVTFASSPIVIVCEASSPEAINGYNFHLDGASVTTTHFTVKNKTQPFTQYGGPAFNWIAIGVIAS